MSKNISLLIGILLSSVLFGQKNFTLTLEFTSIENKGGQILYELTNIQGEQVKGGIVPFTKEKITIQIKDIPSGKYTVKAFHDINSDEKLNTGTFGIPTEPYGFSNNARGIMGPPSQKEQLFDISKGSTLQSIYLK